MENSWKKYPDVRPTEYGKYEVYRQKCGKQQYQTWNNTGWAYDNNDITHWRKIISPIEAENETTHDVSQNRCDDELYQALVGLVADIKSKPNDTRYATHIKIAEKAIENYKAASQNRMYSKENMIKFADYRNYLAETNTEQLLKNWEYLYSKTETQK